MNMMFKVKAKMSILGMLLFEHDQKNAADPERTTDFTFCGCTVA
jgi:hypothetical protein